MIRRQSKRECVALPEVSAGERATLQQIYRRIGVGKEKYRKLLASKGLITSHIGSRALLTDCGFKVATKDALA